MKKITYLFIFALGIMMITTSCEKSDSDNENEPNSFYKIVNKGNAGVSSINDFEDTVGLSVAQAIPSVSNEAYPANMPILFFFDDKILLSSITEENFIVTENDIKIKGTVSISEASNGYAILSYTPERQFAANAHIKVVLTTDLQDDAGMGNTQDTVLEYTTTSSNNSSFTGNTGFENDSDGVNFVGDGNILTGAQGCVAPFGGSSFGAITTGLQLISGDNAIGEASSIMILGPINNNVSSISFNYNFLSAEFQEYVGSEYDDSFMAIVVGENGAHSEFVASVNTIGVDGNTSCSAFPGMPDNGDAYFGTTGWLNKQISFDSVGDSVYVIFVVTDVTDAIYSSIVCIDDVSFN